jgi:glycerol-1-phosphatase
LFLGLSTRGGNVLDFTGDRWLACGAGVEKALRRKEPRLETVPEITLDELMKRYAVLLLDAYGVLVHSSGPLPGAAELIRKLNAVAKPYHVLTNDASKLPATAAARYRGYGLAVDPERIITSGALLVAHFAEHRLGGARCAVLGPEDGVRYVEQAGGRVVSAGERFDVLVIADESGFPFLETVDVALSSLCRELDAGRRVHLVLPNPDLIYPSGNGGFGFASGSIALMFEAALGLRYPGRDGLRFTRLGKPHPAIFAEAVRRSGTRDMVVVGDQIETDVRGARAFGLDAVLVSTGVTAGALDGTPPELRPTYRLRSLA